MNLFKKFMAIIKKELQCFGISDFSGLDDIETIALNLNVKNKMIRQEKYLIEVSPNVLSTLSNLDDSYKNAYNEIKKRLQQGDDINPFLSKLAIKPKFQDYLLLDWDIHHFHLNNTNTGTYFNNRSDYLLMVIFFNNKAHFIEIEHHNDPEVFVKREYLKIIKDTWPNIIARYEMVGVIDLRFNPTNDEIKTFRRNQINPPIKVDDKVYMPIGGGINTAGTGIDHTKSAMKWKKYIEEIENAYSFSEDQVLNDIFKKTELKNTSLDLDFSYHNGQLVLVDKNSNLIIQAMIA